MQEIHTVNRTADRYMGTAIISEEYSQTNNRLEKGLGEKSELQI